MTRRTALKLSFCIATYNRAHLLGETLESILVQHIDGCEIVVCDNASTDDTESVVAKYARRFDRLQYFKQDQNKGLDRNFDCAVELAHGDYCWLMSDDDLIKPGAVARVLEALRVDLSVVLVNYEFQNFDMSKVLQPRSVAFETDRIYCKNELNRLFDDVDDGLWFIGNVIVKRAVWLARERERYYGSLFIHVAVIFQSSLPGDALVIAEPLVRYRMGNTHSYSQQLGEILFVKWPSLAQSLTLVERARKTVRSAEPWNNPSWLLVLRGWGVYSVTEYRRWIRPRLQSVHHRMIALLVALFPGTLVNTILASYYSFRPDRGRELHWMKHSRFHLRNLRWSGRKA